VAEVVFVSVVASSFHTTEAVHLGEDKFEQMCELFNEFFVILETERAELMAKLK
jgi:hypothetical protein